MNDTSINLIINHSLNNLIHREIGCFTDELISAERYYVLIDDSFKSSFNQLINYIEAQELNVSNASDLKMTVSNKDVLIIVTAINDNGSIKEAARSFKERGARVIAITKGWSTQYDDYIHERVGVSIHNEGDLSDNEVTEAFEMVLESIQRSVLDRLDGLTNVL